MSGLSESDTEAISRAVRILSEAGYRVTEVDKGRDAANGVEFTMDVTAPTRTQSFEPQSEDVREAAIDAPEYGMGGNRIED